MTVKSQLHSCGESLMAGVRAEERAGEPSARVLATLRACQDVVERLEQSSAEVSVHEVEIALRVVKQAAVELAAEPVANIVRATVRNALDRLERLHAELNS